MSQVPSGISSSSGSAFGLLGSGLAGGLLSGGAAYIGYRGQKKAIEDAAEEDFKRIGDYVTQSRVDRILETERLARDAQVAVGSALNTMPEGLATLETIASRVVAGVATDQFAIDEELRRRETAAAAEMKNVATGASNAIAGAAGRVGASFGEGVETGMNLYNKVEALKGQQKDANRQPQIYANQNEQMDMHQQVLDEMDTQAHLRTKYERGVYLNLVAGNEALANSAGTRVGMAQIFGDRHGGPTDPYEKWIIGGPPQ